MRYIFISYLILQCSWLYSQVDCQLSISGRVVDKESREEMCYAAVWLKEIDLGASANEDGYFKIEGLCPGKYTLVCQHLGYDPMEISLQLVKDTTCNFYIHTNAEWLNGVTIEEHLDKVESVQSDVVLDGPQLDRLRSSTLGATLDKVSGVYTLNTGNSISKPVLHGMHSKRLLILNNGVRQEGQQWGQEHGPEIDPFVAKKITVVRGAAGVKYGPDAIAGVILVDPAPVIAPTGIRGDLYLVGNSNGMGGGASLMLEGSFNRLHSLSWRIQGTLRKSGDLAAANYLMANTGSEEYDFSAGLGYHREKFGTELYFSMFKTQLGILSASHTGNLTDLQNAIQADQPLIMREFSYNIDRPRQKITHYLAKGKLYFKTGNLGKFEALVAFQENRRNEYDNHGNNTDASLSFILQTVNARFNWDHSFHKKLKGSVGIDGMYQTNRWNGFYFIPNFRNITAGIYWFENLKLGHWDLEAGLRYDISHIQAYYYQNNQYKNPAFLYQNFSANVGALYHVNDHLSFRANYGLAWRPPHVSELFSNGLHHGSASYEIGDENLQPERAHNVNISASLNYSRFRINITGYYYYIQDFIYLQPTLQPVLTIRGAFPGFKYTGANVDIKGIDLDVDINMTKNLVFNSKTSLLWAWNYTADDYLIQMPPFRFDNNLTYNFKGNQWFREPFISISSRVVTQQIMAPHNADYAAPPDAYFLLGLNAGVKLTIKKVQHIYISMSITNLLNTPYRDYMNRYRYFTDDMGRNVLLNIKIPLEFSSYKNKK